MNDRYWYNRILFDATPATAYFGHPILELFGHDTESAYRTLLYLILGAVLHSIFGLPAIWLQYSGHEKNGDDGFSIIYCVKWCFECLVNSNL